MIRVHINTPGKVIVYRDYPPLRSPVFVDINDEESLKGFKQYLDMMGISDYTTEVMDDKLTSKPVVREVKGLKRKIVSGPGAGGGAKLTIK
jgi:hypothetical protein